MRFEEFELINYGGYENRVLPLGRTHGLQLVHGRNGDGKTTTLESTSDLLFGFPERTRHDYRFPSNSLKLRARISCGDGSSIDVIRRKGRKNTLSAPDGTLLADDALDPILAGIDKPLFETMFALSHERLREGGQALLEARGELGEALFGAGLGSSGVHRLIDQYERRAEEIFAPRAAKPLLNAALKELDEARREVRELTLPAAQRRRLEAEVAEAQERLASNNTALRAARTGYERAKRLAQVIPHVVQRSESVSLLAALAGAPRLPADATERRAVALTARSTARRTHDEATLKMKGLRSSIEALELAPELLARADEVDDLFSRRGGYLNDVRDLPRVIADRDAALAEAQRIVNAVAPGRTLGEAEELRPQPGLRQAVGETKQALAIAAEREQTARVTLAELEADLARAKADRPHVQDDVSVDGAQAALAAARKRGDLDTALVAAQRDAEAKQRRAAVELGSLSFWDATVEDLTRLKTPSDETIAAYESRFVDLDGDIHTVRADVGRCERRLRQIADDLAVFQTSKLPTETEITDCRTARSQMWDAIRHTWLDGHDGAAASYGSNDALADSFETATSGADDLVDRARQHAQRIADRDRLQAEQHRTEEERKLLEASLASLLARRDALDGEWQSLWAPVPARTPSEMRAWSRDRLRVVEHAEAAAAAQAVMDRASDALQCGSDVMRASLAAVGRGGIHEQASYGLLVEALESAVERLVAARSAAEEAERRILRLEEQVQKATKNVDGTGATVAAEREQWHELIKQVGDARASHPTQVEETLSALETLFASLDEAAKLERRVTGIRRQRDDYAAAVAAVVVNVAPDVRGLAVDQAILTLVERLRRAEDREIEFRSLEERIGEQETALGDATQALSNAEAELALLCEIAGTDVDGLEDAERRAAERDELERRISALETTIIEVGGERLEDAIAAAEDSDLAEVSAEIGACEDLVTRLEELHTEFVRDVVRLEEELNKNAGSNAAAAAEERAQAAAARCRRLTEEYTRVKLAGVRLRRAIGSYRERNQGPILARARELFPTLTLGGFHDIAVVGGGEELAIVGKRGDLEVPVSDMSDGERDALYLALRLASLEHHFASNEPMPLIVDDILIGLDEDRVKAAVEALGELAKKTQVIVFTHHTHVVEIAERTLEAIAVHRLRDCDAAQPVVRAA